MCNYEYQGKTNVIRLDTKVDMWPTTQRATVLHKFGEEPWGMWDPNKLIIPVYGKQDYQWQAYDGSMSRQLFKGFIRRQFWNNHFLQDTCLSFME